MIPQIHVNTNVKHLFQRIHYLPEESFISQTNVEETMFLKNFLVI